MILAAFSQAELNLLFTQESLGAVRFGEGFYNPVTLDTSRERIHCHSSGVCIPGIGIGYNQCNHLEIIIFLWLYGYVITTIDILVWVIPLTTISTSVPPLQHVSCRKVQTHLQTYTTNCIIWILGYGGRTWDPKRGTSQLGSDGVSASEWGTSMGWRLNSFWQFRNPIPRNFETYKM